jgi:hypothetical protein
VEELRYFVFVCGWAVIGRIVLELDFAHPIAIAAIWLVGFVWFTGWLAVGPKAADALTLHWLSMLGGMAVIAILIYVLSIPFT